MQSIFSQPPKILICRLSLTLYLRLLNNRHMDHHADNYEHNIKFIYELSKVLLNNGNLQAMITLFLIQWLLFDSISGFQTRNVRCLVGLNTTVEEKYCEAVLKPTSSRTCNNEQCRAIWQAQAWSEVIWTILNQLIKLIPKMFSSYSIRF